MVSHFLKLPPEVLTAIFSLTPASDAPKLRAVCREFEQTTFHLFAKEFFTKRRPSFTKASLHQLLDIVSHKGLGPYINNVMFRQEAHDTVESFNQKPELEEILTKIATCGHKISLGIAYGTSNFIARKMNRAPIDRYAPVLKYILSIAESSGMLLDSFTLELCHQETFRQNNISSRRNRPQCLLMNSLQSIVESSTFTDIGWVIIFEAAPTPFQHPTYGVHASARFCYNHSTHTLRGISFSNSQLTQIDPWLRKMPLEDVSFAYADIIRWHLMVLACHHATLKRLKMHSVSLYEMAPRNYKLVGGDWATVAPVMLGMNLEYCALEYLWDGPLASVASELITAED